MVAPRLVFCRSGIIAGLLFYAAALCGGCMRGGDFGVTALPGITADTIAVNGMDANILANFNIDVAYSSKNNNPFSTQFFLTALFPRAPHMAKADVYGDGLEDVFICGSSTNPRRLYIQVEGGIFK